MYYRMLVLFQIIHHTTFTTLIILHASTSILIALYIDRMHNIQNKQYPPIEKGSDARQLSFNFNVVTLLNRPK